MGEIESGESERKLKRSDFIRIIQVFVRYLLY